MRAHLRINACHVPMATVFPEDVCRACTFRSFCASKNCGAGTLKHGAFEFERGRPKREGGRSATVCRFGENPGIIGGQIRTKTAIPAKCTVYKTAHGNIMIRYYGV